MEVVLDSHSPDPAVMEHLAHLVTVTGTVIEELDSVLNVAELRLRLG
ncbi:MAG: hypothetical protein LUH23_07300 [Oscillospiraceae bacterium]|nr:hypothetical protein [Oscillospiraceae bacterium]